MSDTYLMTAETVSEGHPDKLADQISDAVLDEYLKIDSKARVACECLLGERLAVVAGEVSAHGDIGQSIPEIVRRILRDTGYDRHSLGFALDEIKIIERIHRQSSEIAAGVDQGDDQLGAGDQGIMIGYATDETPEMMPMPIVIGRRIISELKRLRKENVLSWLRPDAKCQVTMVYSDGRPAAVHTIVVSTQHDPSIKLSELQRHVKQEIVYPALSIFPQDNQPIILINPAGTFTTGGPGADTGLTGRKVAVDSYGPFCPVGGGAFSGKDATKVDRSGAYAARFIAKNIVAAGIAPRCTVQVSYAIGCAQPVSINIRAHGVRLPNKIDPERIVGELVDLRPRAIIDKFDLARPRFLDTARYGHFGVNSPAHTWEITQSIPELIEALRPA